MSRPWDDGILCAYVDGELDGPTARAVEAWLAEDPAAGATLRRLHDAAGMMRAAFGGEVADPLPGELAEMLREKEAADIAPDGPPPRRRFRWLWWRTEGSSS